MSVCDKYIGRDSLLETNCKTHWVCAFERKLVYYMFAFV